MPRNTVMGKLCEPGYSVEGSSASIQFPRRVLRLLIYFCLSTSHSQIVLEFLFGSWCWHSGESEMCFNGPEKMNTLSKKGEVFIWLKTLHKIQHPENYPFFPRWFSLWHINYATSIHGKSPEIFFILNISITLVTCNAKGPSLRWQSKASRVSHAWSYCQNENTPPHSYNVW